MDAVRRNRSMCFSHLGVFLISVKPLTTENKTAPEICKITALREYIEHNPVQKAKLRKERQSHEHQEALLWQQAHFFLTNFKQSYLKKSSNEPHIREVEKPSFTNWNFLWKLRKTYSGFSAKHTRPFFLEKMI